MSGPGIGAALPEGAPEGAYLIPQTVYVGDTAQLVIPLDAAYERVMPFTQEAGLPSRPDIRLLSAALESRGGVSSLRVTFIPYSTGRIPLPALTLPVAGGKPIFLEGIQVPVASLVGDPSEALSAAARPLMPPGATLLLSGAAAGIVAVIFALLFLRIGKQRQGLERLFRGLRLHALRLLLRASLALLARADARGRISPRETLARASRCCRRFLTRASGLDCMALSPAEIAAADLPAPLAPDRAALSAFFRRADEARFSGLPLSSAAAAACMEGCLGGGRLRPSPL